jgi:arylsulfatase A-like enzyme
VNAENGATEADRRHISDQYDAAVRHADHFVEQLVDHLEREGLLERTIFIVTSDHGKELLDRGWMAHGHSLYEELIHVPLLIYVPGEEGDRRDEVVSSIDLVPTVLDLLGLPAAESVQGLSLAPLVRGEPFEGRAILSEQHSGPFHKLTLRGDHQKFMRRDLVVGTDDRGALPREFFDLAADPGERHNALDGNPEAESFGAMLDQVLTRLDTLSATLDEQVERSENSVLRPDVEQALREAGYIR